MQPDDVFWIGVVMALLGLFCFYAGSRYERDRRRGWSDISLDEMRDFEQWLQRQDGEF